MNDTNASTITYAEAKASKEALDARVREASKALQVFPKGPMGLTPDHIKFSPEYRAAKARYASEVARFGAFNRAYQKAFAKEIKADRAALMAERTARFQPATPETARQRVGGTFGT